MGSKVRNAISKRRPKQNIIAMILKNAKSSVKERDGSHTTATSGSSRRSRSQSTDRPGKADADVSNHYHGSKRGILQSAVELTRRSKRSSSRARPKGRRGKKVAFMKGQKAFYRSAKGIAKVTVVGIHHDAKLEPYYTIKLRDGKEKQTDGKHLTPMQEEKKEEDKEKKGKREESVGTKGGEVKDSKKRGGKEIVGSMNSMTDPLSESEVEEEVIDYTEEGDEDEPRPTTGGGESEAEEEFIDYTEPEAEEEEEPPAPQKFDLDQECYYRSPAGPVSKVKVLSYGDKFGYSVSMPDGTRKDGIKPSRLATLMELSSKELSSLMKERNRRQSIQSKSERSHGSHDRASHGSSHDRSSHGSHDRGGHRDRQKAHASSKLSSSKEEVCEAAEAGYEAEAEPVSGGSEETLSKEAAANDILSNNANDEPANDPEGGIVGEGEGQAAPLALPSTVQMVEAKTETGGSKMVPLYEAGMNVHYKNAEGTQPAAILDVHLDDLLEPYYSIRLPDGREKQTDNAHIVFLAGDGHPEEEGSQGDADEGKAAVEEGEGEKEEPNDAGSHAEKERILQDEGQRRRSVSALRSSGRSASDDEARRSASQRRNSLRNSLNKQLEYNEKMRDNLKAMVEEQLQKEELNAETLTRKHSLEANQSDRSAEQPNESSKKKPQDPLSASEANLTSSSSTPVDAQVAPALVMSSLFCVDDDVLYTSSKGQQCQAVVTKTNRDKKNRPYYVIRLPDGKEKSVYGHRLRPNVQQGHLGHEDGKRRSRSRSRGVSREPSSRSSSKVSKPRGRSTSKVSKSSRDPTTRVRRSNSINSIDSAKSNAGSEARSEGGNTLLSNSSRRSAASRERSVGSASHERRSSRRNSSEPLRGSRRERSPSAARSERGPQDPIADSNHKSSRSRSQSVRRTKSIFNSSSDRHPESSKKHRRQRSTSRAPSEDSSRASGSRGSMRPRLKLKSSGRSVERPKAPVEDDLDLDVDDEGTRQNSISKLKSFRKNFASMRKH